ncbi:MAG: hypothetical protein M3N98_07765 [Actinomycetota bacterium]|nr:hypothetical protein [Actinomycetota bacterium]
MNVLDSRFLRQGDCFVHHFSTEGTLRYQLSLLAVSLAAHDDDEPSQTVVVGAGSSTVQRQHNVTVRRVDGELVADPAQLEIAKGDLVLWSGDASAVFGFRVRGRFGDEVIDSAALRNGSVYTHAFGLPGHYAWVDANGSGVRGQIDVAAPDPADFDQERWMRSLEEGTLVTVKGKRATPASVKVRVGQTVVWAVQSAPGVSITDASLLTNNRQKGE